MESEARLAELHVTGVQHYRGLDAARAAGSFLVRLKREPLNPHDPSAVEVLVLSAGAPLEEVKLGYVPRLLAALLAPCLDSGEVALDESKPARLLQGEEGATHTHARLAVTLLRGDIPKPPWHEPVLQPPPSPPPAACADAFDRSAAQEARVASEAEVAFGEPREWRRPYLSGASSLARSVRVTEWPPGGDVLERLGLGSDAAWWRDRGLEHPNEWTVTLAALTKNEDRIDTMTWLEDGSPWWKTSVFNVCGCWTPETLDGLRALVAPPGFFFQRSGDSGARAFGQGPYVFGQTEDKLVILPNHELGELQKRVLAGKAAVCAAVTLRSLESKECQSNSLVFNVTERTAGFRYHVDEKADLLGKAAVLESNQLVSTTVLYEREEDSGKECVLWRPAESYKFGFKWDNVYDAVMMVVTTDGCEHVQTEGVQRAMYHGVYHTPGNGSARCGSRISITCRRTREDYQDRMDRQPEGTYRRTITQRCTRSLFAAP